MSVLHYPFTEEQAAEASRDWGCNCGPSALAFALQRSLVDVRAAVESVGFAEKRYTSPTMMKGALAALGATVRPFTHSKGIIRPAEMFGGSPALVRVQWTGPWTAAGANPRWAYAHTHWIVCWFQVGLMPGAVHRMVFDVNGGVMALDQWEQQIVPILGAMSKRWDGGWRPTHVWFIAGRGSAPPAPNAYGDGNVWSGVVFGDEEEPAPSSPLTGSDTSPAVGGRGRDRSL